MGPLFAGSSNLRGENASLRAENGDLRHEIAHLRAEVDRLKRQLDANGEYAVYIVPGEKHLAQAFASMYSDSSVSDGDRVRVAGTGEEFVRRGGHWEKLE